MARAWGSTPSGRHRVHRGSASCRLSLVPRALAARASSALPENAGPIRCRYRACVAKRQERPCGGPVLCARLHVSSAGRRRARREARRTGAFASMATCVCHHGATARQGGAAGAEEAPHSRVWAHPARRPVAERVPPFTLRVAVAKSTHHRERAPAGPHDSAAPRPFARSWLQAGTRGAASLSATSDSDGSVHHDSDFGPSGSSGVASSPRRGSCGPART